MFLSSRASSRAESRPGWPRPLARASAGAALWAAAGGAVTLAGLAVAGDVRLAAAAAAALLLVAAALAVLVRRLAACNDDAVLAGRLAAAFDAEPAARLVTGPGGVELYRNPAAARLLGSAEAPLAPLLARLAGDERQRDEIDRLAASAARPASDHAELSFTGADGVREWLALSVRPVAVPPGAVLWSVADVTPRRAIEETLRREHEAASDFLDFLPVGCYSADAEGRFRYVNQRLAEWLGRGADELVGMDLREVLGVVPNPEDDRAETRLRGRNGDVFQAFVSHTVYDDGGETVTRSVVVRDLMPERLWERALKSAERRFRWLFDDAPVGIVLVDPDGTINACNRAFEALLAADEAEPSGRPVTDFVGVEDRVQVGELLSRVLMGTLPGGHLEVRIRARRELVASLYVSPTGDDGAVSGLMLHFIDTTEQKNLEIQFAQSQKMQAMGQLAGGVAHDFNNLLTAMIGFCDLLLQRHGPGDPSFADIMQVRQNANRAASLVRQLLAFSRRQTLQPRLMGVTDALAELSNLLRRLLGETIELRMVHGRDLGLVRVDPGQFDQVIINLAVNARDAMPGGGSLTIRTQAVTVERPQQRGDEVMAPGEYVMIEVADTGTGIPKENLGRIFEPFFSTKEVGAGTGLGLSTVYGIVRQTDGFVFVESAPGHGAVFTIHLPRVDAESAASALPPPRPAPESAREAAASASAGDLTGTGTILLVEDEDAVRLFGARALRNKGYKVLEARSGENALEVLKGGEAIDVLVSDVVMPGMDGATLARLVRMERPGIRVILISGYSEDVALADFDGQDGMHFLPKPFSLKQLAGKVKEVMAEGRAG